MTMADMKVGRTDTGATAEFYQPVQVDKDYGRLSFHYPSFGGSEHIVVRLALPPEQMEDSVRTVVRSIDPKLPLTHALL